MIVTKIRYLTDQEIIRKGKDILKHIKKLEKHINRYQDVKILTEIDNIKILDEYEINKMDPVKIIEYVNYLYNKAIECQNNWQEDVKLVWKTTNKI